MQVRTMVILGDKTNYVSNREHNRCSASSSTIALRLFALN